MWSEMLASLLAVGAVYGQNTSIVSGVFFPGFYGGTMLGSVIAPGPTATIYKVGCPTDAVCFYPMPMTVTAGPSTFAATYTQNPVNDLARTGGDILPRVDATYTYNCTLYKQAWGSCMITATGTTFGHPAAPMYKTSAATSYTYPVQDWASLNLLMTTVDSYSVVTLTGSQANANTAAAPTSTSAGAAEKWNGGRVGAGMAAVAAGLLAL